jgi:hypothetical protein
MSVFWGLSSPVDCCSKLAQKNTLVASQLIGKVSRLLTRVDSNVARSGTYHSCSSERLLVETAHPYAIPTVQSWDIEFPASTTSWITLVFDPRCGTAGASDRMVVYRDSARREKLLDLYGAPSDWPSEPVLLPGRTCTLVFEVGLECLRVLVRVSE